MTRGKIIPFPIERQDNNLEKDRCFRDAVDEILLGMDDFFANFDIFSGRRKATRKDK